MSRKKLTVKAVTEFLDNCFEAEGSFPVCCLTGITSLHYTPVSGYVLDADNAMELTTGGSFCLNVAPAKKAIAVEDLRKKLDGVPGELTFVVLDEDSRKDEGVILVRPVISMTRTKTKIVFVCGAFIKEKK